MNDTTSLTPTPTPLTLTPLTLTPIELKGTKPTVSKPTVSKPIVSKPIVSKPIVEIIEPTATPVVQIINPVVQIIEPTKIPRLKVIAGYARVSVASKITLSSLNAQIEYLQKMIDGMPGVIGVDDTTPTDTNISSSCVGSIFYDYGVSGTKTERPGFQKLLTLCRQNRIDIIITKSISRFCRNTVDLLNTVRELKALGIEIIFASATPISTMSLSGELLLTLLASQAEEEAKATSANIKWRLKQKFINGEIVKYRLFGYSLGTAHAPAYIINSEAETVKAIFNLYLNGYGVEKIANLISMAPRTVWRILRQEKYTGSSILQKTYRENFRTHINHGEKDMYFVENTHPVIIDKEQFDKVQEEILRRQLLPPGTQTTPAPGANTPAPGANTSDEENANTLGTSCSDEEDTNKIFSDAKEELLLPAPTNTPSYIHHGRSAFTSKIICSCGRTFRRKTSKGGTNKKGAVVYWTCGNRLRGRCNAKPIPESILIKLTKEVLNSTSDEFTTDEILQTSDNGANTDDLNGFNNKIDYIRAYDSHGSTTSGTVPNVYSKVYSLAFKLLDGSEIIKAWEPPRHKNTTDENSTNTPGDNANINKETSMSANINKDNSAKNNLDYSKEYSPKEFNSKEFNSKEFNSKESSCQK